MASSVSTNRYSICTECIGYHLGIVTGIGTGKDDAMSTASDPHPLSEHPYPYLSSRHALSGVQLARAQRPLVR